MDITLEAKVPLKASDVFTSSSSSSEVRPLFVFENCGTIVYVAV